MNIEKQKNDLRCLTFNVNGLRTLFQHYPFSRMNNSLEEVFTHFDSDIITFQELKTDRKSISRWGKVNGFSSFITVPKTRKGYSGVGCWIRNAAPDDPLYKLLKVVRAEEGITGFLNVSTNGSCFRESSEGIGGYTGLDFVDKKKSLEIDSEGRCVLVQLGSKTVVISTYCPANSAGAELGEINRLLFLKLLFRRVRNLHDLGMHIILMGDINVSRDLIDHATALDENGISSTLQSIGSAIETKYHTACINFITDPTNLGRKYLNKMLADSIVSQYAQDGILIDTTRYIQGRDRLKMYTVWNTIKNTRPVNYGSRIDFILVSKELKSAIKKGDILPEIMGSDHCPVYVDLQMTEYDVVENLDGYKMPIFEAATKYSLNRGDIMGMFQKFNKSKHTTSTPIANAYKISKTKSLKGGGLVNDIRDVLTPGHKLSSSTVNQEQSRVVKDRDSPPITGGKK